MSGNTQPLAEIPQTPTDPVEADLMRRLQESWERLRADIEEGRRRSIRNRRLWEP